MNLKRYAKKIADILDRSYPEAACSLEFKNPLELLIATILSAQCTDIQVNKITPKLFATFRNAKSFAEAPIQELETLIHSTGFYRNKAKNIQGACRRIVDHFEGEVPQTMEELLTLPGVGRKTANVVLGSAFDRNEGFVVDTHVFRLSHRMGLAKGNTPAKVELEMMKLFPSADRARLSHALVLHGRAFCMAKKPNCSACPMTAFCPRIGVEQK